MIDQNIDFDFEAQRFSGDRLKSHCCENKLHSDCSGEVIEDTHEDHFINHGKCDCGCHLVLNGELDYEF